MNNESKRTRDDVGDRAQGGSRFRSPEEQGDGAPIPLPKSSEKRSISEFKIATATLLQVSTSSTLEPLQPDYDYYYYSFYDARMYDVRTRSLVLERSMPRSSGLEVPARHSETVPVLNLQWALSSA